MHKSAYKLGLLANSLIILAILSLRDILSMITLKADIRDDVEENCEIWFKDSSFYEICRFDYLVDLQRVPN
jgi:hypothetical protein